MSPNKLTESGFEIKTFFTSKEVKHRYQDSAGECVYVLHEEAAYTCCICGYWVPSIPHSSPGNRVHSSYIKQVRDTYYVLPKYSHSNCIEVFQLCPPL